jgi:hypothetical protein
MGNQTISFHLTESQTALAGSTFGWLTSENLYSSAAAGVQLAAYQMMQTLVVNNASEYLGFVGFTSLAVHHRFATGVCEAVSQQTSAQRIFLLTTEGSSIDVTTFHRTDFAADHLKHVSDRHSRGDRVRIDDEIRDDAVDGERHILLVDKTTDDTLLTVPASELIADFRDLLGPYSDATQQSGIEGFGYVYIVHPS